MDPRPSKGASVTSTGKTSRTETKDDDHGTSQTIPVSRPSGRKPSSSSTTRTGPKMVNGGARAATDPEGPTGRLATWLAATNLNDVPTSVREHAKHLMLDGVGC